LGNTGDVNRALEAGEKGLQDLEQLSHSNPANATFREYLGEAYNLIAPLQQKKGNLDQALAYYRDANRIFADLKKADPANALARANFGFSAVGVAQELLSKHEIQPAMAQIRQAIATFDGIEPKNRYDREGQAESYSTFGTAYEALADHESSPPKKAADLREARIWFQKSLGTLQQSIRESPPDSTTTHDIDQARAELAKCESALAKLSQ
jgi:tetratricopeptide (TPR) repeat protein